MTIIDTPAAPAPRASHRLTTSKAMVEAIAQEMERDPSVFYLGEAISWKTLVGFGFIFVGVAIVMLFK